MVWFKIRQRKELFLAQIKRDNKDFRRVYLLFFKNKFFWTCVLLHGDALMQAVDQYNPLLNIKGQYNGRAISNRNKLGTIFEEEDIIYKGT